MHPNAVDIAHTQAHTYYRTEDANVTWSVHVIYTCRICTKFEYIFARVNNFWIYAEIPLDLCDTLSHINQVVNAPTEKCVFYPCTLHCCSCSLFPLSLSVSRCECVHVCAPNDDPIVYFISLRCALRVKAQEQSTQGITRYKHVKRVEHNISSDSDSSSNIIGTRIILRTIHSNERYFSRKRHGFKFD